MVLVDGGSGYGGVDVVTDTDCVPGPRWINLRGVNADVDAERLLAALPRRDGVAVLAHDRETHWAPDEVVATHVVTALAAVTQHAVVTVPPGPCWATTSALCDQIILLVRGTLGSLAAAEHASGWFTSERLGVITLATPTDQRGPICTDLRADAVAHAPRRWELGDLAAADVLSGEWPGRHDRTMRRLTGAAADYAMQPVSARERREASWV